MDIDDATAKITTMVSASQDEDYGTDIELDEELEGLLFDAESQVLSAAPGLALPVAEAATTSGDTKDHLQGTVMDIEDVAEAGPSTRSPFEEFRSRGRLSVSDLVGLVWCEVQYDYRLRTKPHLPPSQRPTVIMSKAGETIRVDTVKVESKERVLKRGTKIHKRLEREIHPQEIKVRAVTQEDTWGLRFLNMFAALEALLELGKCRELPVIGTVGGTLVMGVIDEIRREPLPPSKEAGPSKEPDKTQTSLTSFFSPTKAKSTPSTERRERTHRIFVSDSKTRASGHLPPESDTLGGRLQVMTYKELLDAMLLAEPLPEPPTSAPDQEVSRSATLPTEIPFSWPRIFAYLGLDMDTEFSDHFIAQSAPVIIGNGLHFNVDQAKTLRDVVRAWERYIVELGLGTPIRTTPGSKVLSVEERNRGRSEDRLELVYRRAGAKMSSRGAIVSRSRKVSNRQGRDSDEATAFSDAEQVEEMLLQHAINESLKHMGAQTRMEETARDDGPIIDSNSNKQAATGSSTGPSVAARPTEVSEEDSTWPTDISVSTSDLPVIEDTNEIVLRGSQAVASQGSPVSSSSSSATSSRSSSPTPSLPMAENISMDLIMEAQPGPSTMTKSKKTTEADMIIGKIAFSHSPRRLAIHLASALQWWMGERQPIGVSVQETRRCGWCEFEENCEWRAQKAAEAAEQARSRRAGSEHP